MLVRAPLAMLLAAATLAAQAPQVGLIGPLPAAAPASTFDVAEKTIVQLLAAQRIGTVTTHDLVEKYRAHQGVRPGWSAPERDGRAESKRTGTG
jgi:hypothetical protein